MKNGVVSLERDELLSMILFRLLLLTSSMHIIGPGKGERSIINGENPNCSKMENGVMSLVFVYVASFLIAF